MFIDFDVAEHIEAVAVGPPGQRVFYLRLLGGGQYSAALKLEKQHVVGLLTAIREILDQIRFQGSPRGAGMPNFPGRPQYEVIVGELRLGYLPEEARIVLEAGELQTEEGQDLINLRFSIALDQGATLVEQLEEIVRSGRPMCALCGGPIDPEGHACPRSNGRWRQEVPRPGPQDS